MPNDTPPITERDRAGPGLLFTVLVLCGSSVLNFYDRPIPGALVEPIRREFQLSDAQNGLLSSAFIWVYALVSLPFGRSDRRKDAGYPAPPRGAVTPVG